MNSPSVQATTGTRPVKEDSLLDYMHRILIPVVNQVRKLVNNINETDPVLVNSSVTLSPYNDLVLADATAAPLALAMPSAARWIRIKVVKVDATGNAVTVSSRFDGPVVLAAQGDSVTLESDGNLFY